MKKSSLLVLLPVLLGVTACTSVKQQLGVGRNSPDEFAVVKRAPLTLPPDYDLRPPAADGAAPAAESAGAARTVIMGAGAAPAETHVGGEGALLEKMGAKNADPAIRDTIDRENGTIALKNQSVREKLIFWKDDEEAPNTNKNPSSVVDPKAEAERLKKNKEEGKPVNDGTVPSIEKKPSTLDKIFK